MKKWVTAIIILLLISVSAFIILKDSPFISKPSSTGMAVASNELSREEAKEAVVEVIQEIVGDGSDMNASGLIPH